jgi:predicted nucleic acid-binding protein
MIVVVDSSPLIALVNLGEIAVLPALFGSVIVPPEIFDELRQPNRPELVRTFAAAPPQWLVERKPALVEPIPALHAGEVAAINLAAELNADLLLIDESAGRKAAAVRQIPVAGTIAVPELAADRKLLDLKEAFARIKATDFWISHRLLDERLKRFYSKRAAP